VPPNGTRRKGGGERTFEIAPRNFVLGVASRRSLLYTSQVSSLSKTQILVAMLAMLLLVALKARIILATNSGFIEPLEALVFLLCVLPVSTEGRGVRKRFEALAYDKQRALQSTGFMKLRRSVRWWSYVSALTLSAVVAVRFDWSVFLTVCLLAFAMAVGTILLDRINGWQDKPKA